MNGDWPVNVCTGDGVCSTPQCPDHGALADRPAPVAVIGRWKDGPGLTNGVRAGVCPPGWVGSGLPAEVETEDSRG